MFYEKMKKTPYNKEEDENKKLNFFLCVLCDQMTGKPQ